MRFEPKVKRPGETPASGAPPLADGRYGLSGGLDA